MAKVIIGGCYRIPIGGTKYGKVIVVAKSGVEFYMIGLSQNVDVSSVLKDSDVIFSGSFYGALIKNGSWELIEIVNHDILSDVKFPFYKVFMDNRYYLESWDRSVSRELKIGEGQNLGARTGYGPKLLEIAMGSVMGTCQSIPDVERIRYNTVVELSRMYS